MAALLYDSSQARGIYVQYSPLTVNLGHSGRLSWLCLQEIFFFQTECSTKKIRKRKRGGTKKRIITVFNFKVNFKRGQQALSWFASRDSNAFFKGSGSLQSTTIGHLIQFHGFLRQLACLTALGRPGSDTFEAKRGCCRPLPL